MPGVLSDVEWKAMDILHQAHLVGLEKMHSMEAAIEGLKRGRPMRL